MILTDDVVERVARALDPDAWRIADEAGGYDKARGIRRALDYSLRQARAALEAATYGEQQGRLRALHEALTPSAATKAAYIGEFRFQIELAHPRLGSEVRSVDVPWTTIKEIMAAILGHAALLSTIGESNLKGDRG